MAKNTGRVTFSVSISRPLLRRLDVAVKHSGVSRSELIVGAVEAYLDESETALKAMANPRVRDAFIGAMAQPGVVRALAAAMGHDLSEAEKQQVFAFLGAEKGDSK